MDWEVGVSGCLSPEHRVGWPRLQRAVELEGRGSGWNPGHRNQAVRSERAPELCQGVRVHGVLGLWAVW